MTFLDLSKTLTDFPLTVHGISAIHVQGDSLSALRLLPDHSVNLILTDPPYHSTKKSNIIGDRGFLKDEDYLAWMREYAEQWHRILKPSGTLYCFCSSAMSARLEIVFSKHFNILSHIIWTKPNAPGFDGWKGKVKKEALRKWYPHSERILFGEPVGASNPGQSVFGEFLYTTRKRLGISSIVLAEMVGAYGKVNHGGMISNWEKGRSIPNEEQFRRLILAFEEVGGGKFADFQEQYAELVRPFQVSKEVEFTDIWTFPSVRPYKGKHPAEKPRDLLRHAISASTREGDVVLDCFAGSGNTALAALSMGRKSITMEIDAELSAVINQRLKEMQDG